MLFIHLGRGQALDNCNILTLISLHVTIVDDFFNLCVMNFINQLALYKWDPALQDKRIFFFRSVVTKFRHSEVSVLINVFVCGESISTCQKF